MTNILDKFFSKTNDKVNQDVAWLLEYGFELDVEQYYGYSLVNEIKIDENFTIKIHADWHGNYNDNGDSWHIHIEFLKCNKTVFFKFKNGEIYVNAERVKTALKNALTEFDQVKRLDIVIRDLLKEQEAKREKIRNA